MWVLVPYGGGRSGWLLRHAFNRSTDTSLFDDYFYFHEVDSRHNSLTTMTHAYVHSEWRIHQDDSLHALIHHRSRLSRPVPLFALRCYIDINKFPNRTMSRGSVFAAISSSLQIETQKQPDWQDVVDGIYTNNPVALVAPTTWSSSGF